MTQMASKGGGETFFLDAARRISKRFFLDWFWNLFYPKIMQFLFSTISGSCDIATRWNNYSFPFEIAITMQINRTLTCNTNEASRM